MTDMSITPRRAETRQRLMDGAMEVFAERGVLAASVEEICDRAGFTRGAFYSNFGSKNDLVLAMLEHDRDLSRAAVGQVAGSTLVQDVTAHPENLATYIGQAVRGILPHSRTGREWIMSVTEVRLYAAREPEIRAAYLAYRRASLADLLAGLVAIVESGGWEFAMPLDSVAEVVDTMYGSSILQALLLDPDGTDEERTHEALRPFVDLLAAIVRPAAAPQPKELEADVA
ncbi:DNA-binding transcriptional regulator, AcrR family [Raineyella antarctica]|uniref:DNA-binding transcriptional regulator, AcrR family n=1 Tax=Raineyella antarctica TaxID=1577474 RepID=A0A1G6HPC0_9ACTN|nr:TetR/AcrR family transcriptional regulator [Raineyella antarctica]SDB96147.1 DNA-binding transcriptional regulator, AcrR family [Raineyella antarctica]